MDTTRVEFVGRQVDRVIETFNQHPHGLTSGQVALIAASIGALAAILPQFIIFFLTRFKEISNQIRELIAEERRIAYLLTELYKELVMHKVHKQYWYRTSEIHHPNTDDSKDSHERHFISNQRSFETMTKIRITMSDYFKTVTLFTNLAGKNVTIDETMSAIKTFKPRKASNFSEISTYEELVKAEAKEEELLNEVYLFYSDCFDRINSEMIKKKSK